MKDKKDIIKLIIIVLIATLVLSLLLNLKTYNAKIILEQERNALQQENTILTKKIEELAAKRQLLEEKVNALSADLTKSSKEKEELKKQLEAAVQERDGVKRQYDAAAKEKNELIEKLKAKETQGEVVPLTDDKIKQLQKEKSDLETKIIQMEAVLKEKEAEINAFKQQPGQIGSQTSLGKPEAAKERIELPTIVVHPQVRASAEEKGRIPSLEGKVLTLNKENNFVIIDLGQDSGVRSGNIFGVFRQDKQIATIEVIQTRANISACDIKNESTPIEVGDTVK